MKKLLVILLILSICAIIVIGCGTTTTPAPTTPAASKPAATTPAATAPAATTPATTAPASPKPTATAPATTAPATPRYGGTLRSLQGVGPGAPIGTPWLADGTSTGHMMFSAEFLLKEQKDASLKPSLVQSYDVNNDPNNSSVTLHLVKGAKFHDGSDFNAQAVKWNLEQNMVSGTTMVSASTNWKSLEVLDDYTIRINFKTWKNTNIRSFADAVSYMVSPTAFKNRGLEYMKWNIVGTGPFIHTGFQRDVSLTFVRNPEYWDKGKPYLDKVEVIIVSDATTAEAVWKSGGADMWPVGGRVASELKAAGHTIIVGEGPMRGSALWPDSANPDSPWSNKKVREAAEYAIDKEGLAKAFGYGFGVPAYQSGTEGSPAYDPSLPPRKYDVAKAKKLLTEAGYPTGFKSTIVCGPFTNNDIAQALQSQFAEAGIQTDINLVQVAAWAGMLTGTWKGILYGPAPGSANPLAAWGLSYSPGSAWFKSWKRPEGMEEAYAAALATPQLDPVLTKKCAAIIYNDVNLISLFLTPSMWAVNKNLKDTGLGSRGFFAWFEPQNAWYSK